jgi:methionine-rich copper-binding protein CopC
MTRAALVGLLLALLVPATVGAHAVLVKSSPARRAVVTTPPPRVELVFNERLEPAYSTVSVSTADNRRVDDGKVAVGPEDPRRLSVGLPPVQAGMYTVKFRVLSVDGHIVEGTFAFEVRPRP